ncbi:endonuclease/exonuclease/phosphatase family protein [Shewanella yunxiaonensis]|uniref:Endonuclease/exonuclease/phosphatase family protein n=2 Tax=Shewanella yunxiaonensis TaxID=2829809 RepID=A0ABX7YY12_9GAMM|nr:endonuclease/exonuclease/phosphatase family protein [Shewanella yunxiaonensis]
MFFQGGMAMAGDLNTLKVATFNVSMEGGNYLAKGQKIPTPGALNTLLQINDNAQICNIAEILQRVRPDIVLLNEFDYIPDPKQGVEAFIKRYLHQPHQGAAAIDYPYYYLAPVNTGEPSPFDLDHDGVASGKGADAWGFGWYPGQYGMVLLSRYPIDSANVRTFQMLKWSAMPGAQRPVDPTTGQYWYNEEQWRALRLSSKSHWDIPVNVNGQWLHILAAHPTPPVFDGPEDRNGHRNHDEIRLWADYLTGGETADYIVDDHGHQRSLPDDVRFVLLGDMNSAPYKTAEQSGAVRQLLDHPRVNGSFEPQSDGGAEYVPGVTAAKYYTASWKERADYVLPSKQGFKVIDGGVFWPTKADPLFRLVANRSASSDHRLVWLTLKITPTAK